MYFPNNMYTTYIYNVTPISRGIFDYRNIKRDEIRLHSFIVSMLSFCTQQLWEKCLFVL